jgi:hypothetical protein
MHESIEHASLVAVFAAKVNAPDGYLARISPHVTQLPQLRRRHSRFDSSFIFNLLTHG